MDTDKIVGYGLLLTGIAIILFGTFSIFQVFTGQKNPPTVFSFETPTISLPGTQVPQLELPKGLDLPEGFSLPEDLGQQTKTEKLEFKVLPDELVNKLVNMSVYFLLMMFIASSGSKIASIGAKMAKDIKVVVKEEKVKRALQGTSQGTRQSS